eukprot:tig00000615_g2594.t1
MARKPNEPTRQRALVAELTSTVVRLLSRTGALQEYVIEESTRNAIGFAGCVIEYAVSEGSTPQKGKKRPPQRFQFKFERRLPADSEEAESIINSINRVFHGEETESEPDARAGKRHLRSKPQARSGGQSDDDEATLPKEPPAAPAGASSRSATRAAAAAVPDLDEDDDGVAPAGGSAPAGPSSTPSRAPAAAAQPARRPGRAGRGAQQQEPAAERVEPRAASKRTAAAATSAAKARKRSADAGGQEGPAAAEADLPPEAGPSSSQRQKPRKEQPPAAREAAVHADARDAPAPVPHAAQQEQQEQGGAPAEQSRPRGPREPPQQFSYRRPFATSINAGFQGSDEPERRTLLIFPRDRRKPTAPAAPAAPASSAPPAPGPSARPQTVPPSKRTEEGAPAPGPSRSSAQPPHADRRQTRAASRADGRPASPAPAPSAPRPPSPIPVAVAVSGASADASARAGGADSESPKLVPLAASSGSSESQGAVPESEPSVGAAPGIQHEPAKVTAPNLAPAVPAAASAAGAACLAAASVVVVSVASSTGAAAAAVAAAAVAATAAAVVRGAERAVEEEEEDEAGASDEEGGLASPCVARGPYADEETSEMIRSLGEDYAASDAGDADEGARPAAALSPVAKSPGARRPSPAPAPGAAAGPSPPATPLRPTAAQTPDRGVARSLGAPARSPAARSPTARSPTARSPAAHPPAARTAAQSPQPMVIVSSAGSSPVQPASPAASTSSSAVATLGAATPGRRQSLSDLVRDDESCGHATPAPPSSLRPSSPPASAASSAAATAGGATPMPERRAEEHEFEETPRQEAKDLAGEEAGARAVEAEAEAEPGAGEEPHADEAEATPSKPAATQHSDNGFGAGPSHTPEFSLPTMSPGLGPVDHGGLGDVDDVPFLTQNMELSGPRYHFHELHDDELATFEASPPRPTPGPGPAPEASVGEAAPPLAPDVEAAASAAPSGPAAAAALVPEAALPAAARPASVPLPPLEPPAPLSLLPASDPSTSSSGSLRPSDEPAPSLPAPAGDSAAPPPPPADAEASAPAAVPPQPAFACGRPELPRHAAAPAGESSRPAEEARAAAAAGGRSDGDRSTAAFATGPAPGAPPAKAAAAGGPPRASAKPVERRHSSPHLPALARQPAAPSLKMPFALQARAEAKLSKAAASAPKPLPAPVPAPEQPALFPARTAPKGGEGAEAASRWNRTTLAGSASAPKPFRPFSPSRRERGKEGEEAGARPAAESTVSFMQAWLSDVSHWKSAQERGAVIAGASFPAAPTRRLALVSGAPAAPAQESRVAAPSPPLPQEAPPLGRTQRPRERFQFGEAAGRPTAAFAPVEPASAAPRPRHELAPPPPRRPRSTSPAAVPGGQEPRLVRVTTSVEDVNAELERVGAPNRIAEFIEEPRREGPFVDLFAGVRPEGEHLELLEDADAHRRLLRAVLLLRTLCSFVERGEHARLMQISKAVATEDALGYLRLELSFRRAFGIELGPHFELHALSAAFRLRVLVFSDAKRLTEDLGPRTAGTFVLPFVRGETESGGTVLWIACMQQSPGMGAPTLDELRNLVRDLSTDLQHGIQRVAACGGERGEPHSRWTPAVRQLLQQVWKEACTPVREFR